MDDPERSDLAVPQLRGPACRAAVLSARSPAGGRVGADVFEHWLDLIDKLVRLAAEVGTPAGAEPLLVPEEVVAILKNARLDATVQKMPCLRSLVRPELAQEMEQVGVIVRTALNRDQGIVEMFTAETTPCPVGRSRKASSGWSTWLARPDTAGSPRTGGPRLRRLLLL
ncbi:hypothetical protein ABZ527_10655 [Streptomyces griseofuscus]|uniref:hypothetical protein n=1 Tax=Streptomyces griseofuscus TaxID=146922 RepID=UPI0033FE2484